MPLSAPEPRRHYHRRAISYDGFLRDDGLWEFEARVSDRKPFATFGMHGQARAPEQAYHDMWVRLTTDADLVIVAVETAMDARPFDLCPAIQPNFQRLIGVKLSKGWRRAVLERLGGVNGCNHMMEMLLPLPSMVIQATGNGRRQHEQTREDVLAHQKKNMKPPVNFCHAWQSDSPVVKEMAPDYYTGTGAVPVTEKRPLPFES